MMNSFLCELCHSLNVDKLLQDLLAEQNKATQTSDEEESSDQDRAETAEGDNVGGTKEDDTEGKDDKADDSSPCSSTNPLVWHKTMKDVHCSAASCPLCKLVMKGWRISREIVIESNIEQAMFDESNPPKDLNFDIPDIPVYANGEVELFLFRESKDGNDGRDRKHTYMLAFKCSPAGAVGSWEAHNSLEALFRVAGVGECYENESTEILPGAEMSALDVIVKASPLSGASIGIAKIWLRTCKEEHGNICIEESATNPFFPSRILDVASEYGDHIFLRAREDCFSTLAEFSLDQRYVALSHCWGQSDGKNVPFITTGYNLSQQMDGIHMADLPQTFRDAVIVTRNLDLRYLWIDSLCIIQDSAEDWEIESSQMASIYRSSYLVISAARSTSDAEGFLGDRQPQDIISLPTENDILKKKNLYLQLLQPSSRRWMSSTGADILSGEPISVRAWCLQERLLPHRILHYTTHQMVWECQCITASEEGDVRLHLSGHHLEHISKTANIQPSIFNQQRRMFEADKINNDVEDESEANCINYMDWYLHMVEDYTARSITKSTDRLPALIGLTTLLAQRSGDTYMAGLWKGGLIEGLMWYQTRERRHDSFESKSLYIAPSWSWVSVPGPVNFPAYNWHKQRAGWKANQADFEALAQYQTHKLLPATTNEYGQLKDGDLTITAPVLNVKSVESLQKAQPKLSKLFGMTPMRSSMVNKTFCLSYGSNFNTKRIWIEGGFDRTFENFQISDLRVVFLARLPVVLAQGFMEFRFGLLVQKLPGGKYKRVGFVDGVILDKARPGFLERMTGANEYTIVGYLRSYQKYDLDEVYANTLASDPLKLAMTGLTII